MRKYCYSPEVDNLDNRNPPGKEKKRKSETLVYIAGPYRGDVKNNVEAAENCAAMVAVLGIGFVCPHSNGRPHDWLELPDEYWLSMTMEIMRRCDAVLLVEGWEKSHGVIAEKKEAERLGIPVILDVDELEKFILEYTE
jgi:hypothetical protein